MTPAQNARYIETGVIQPAKPGLAYWTAAAPGIKTKAQINERTSALKRKCMTAS
jgi:hypothetical protein